MGFHFCPSLVLLDATLYRCHVMINDCFFLPARMSYTYDQDVTILAIGFWVDGRQRGDLKKRFRNGRGRRRVPVELMHHFVLLIVANGKNWEIKS